MKIADLIFTDIPTDSAPARSTCGRYVLHFRRHQAQYLLTERDQLAEDLGYTYHQLISNNLLPVLERAPWDAVISFTFPNSFAS